MVVPEIRPHRAFVAVALLPLLEPLCASFALGKGSPLFGRIAAGWLSFAPGFQLLSIALALLAFAIVVKGLFGEREAPPNLRFWARVALAAFFSVTTVHVWYPDDAHRAARTRAEAAVESTRNALQRYAKHHRTLPADLTALVPDYVVEVPDPRVAGSHLAYRRVPGRDHLFELTVPCPGSRKPLARYEERESRLRRVFDR